MSSVESNDLPLLQDAHGREDKWFDRLEQARSCALGAKLDAIIARQAVMDEKLDAIIAHLGNSAEFNAALSTGAAKLETLLTPVQGE